MATQDAVQAYIVEASNVLNSMQDRIEDAKVHVRVDTKIDLVVGAHINRILHTARTVFALAAAGNFFDSSTLARTLIEHEVSLQFLYLQDDQANACSRFALKGLEHTASRHEALNKHFPAIFRRHGERLKKIRSIAEQADYSAKYQSQVSFITRLGGPAHVAGFVRDVVYADLSVHSHPRAIGLDDLSPPTLKAFKWGYKPKWDECGRSAFVAFICSSSCLGAASLFWGLPFTNQFYEQAETLLRNHPEIGAGVYEGDDDLPDI